MKLGIWLVAAVMAAGSAWAAIDDNVVPNLDQGTKVLEGSGSYDDDTPVGSDFMIQLGYGYFIADNLELAALVGYRDNEEFNTYEIGGRLEYNIQTDTALVPFAGAAILFAGADADNSDKDEDTVVGRISGGVKYFLTDNLALALYGIYDKAADDIYIDDDGDADDDNMKALFAIRYYFD